MAEENNNIGGRVSLDITDFRANIAQLNRDIRVIESGFRATAAGLGDWGASAEGLQSRITALNGIIAAQNSKVENLRREYERVAQQQGENSRAAQDLLIRINNETAALNRSQAELRDVTNRLNNFGQETENATNATENFAEQQENLNKIFDNVKTAALGVGVALAGSLVAGFTSAINTTDDMTKALNSLQAETGVADDNMGEMKDTMLEIYKNNFGESFQDIGKSMSEIKNQTGASGEELKKLTENAYILKDTFDFEVNESVRAANMLMQQFGMTGDEAYNLIAQGAQWGLDKNGDLLDTINEYSVQFKQLGFSSEEMFNMLANGAMSGTWSVDKLGDAVKEFGIRAKDGSKGTTEAFNTLGLDAIKVGNDFAAGGEKGRAAFELVTSKLLAMKDPMDQNTTGVALFGTMWEDLGAKGIAALTNVEGEITNSNNALQKINEIKYDSFGEAISGIGRQMTAEVLIPIGERIMPVLNDLANRIATFDFTPILNGFQWFLDNANTIATLAIAIGTAMLTWNVVTTIQSVITAIKAWQAVNQGMTVAQWALNAALNANPIAIVITAVAALTAAIVYLWNTNEDFRKNVLAVWNTIKTTVVNTINAVINFVKENWIGLSLLLANPVAGALKLLYDLNPKFKKWVDELWNSIVNTLNTLPQKMKEIGVNIIEGIASGITSKVKSLADTVANAAKSALNAAKSALGINSPSRVFRDEVGQMIGAGMAEGIVNSAKSVNMAMDGLNKQLVSDGELSLNAKLNGKSSKVNSETNNTSAPQSSSEIVVNVPITLDGKVLTTSTSRIQFQNNLAKARALGVNTV